MKRAGNQTMLKISVLFLLIALTVCRESVESYMAQYPDMDQSAALACYVLNGQIRRVDLDSDAKGFTCKYTAQVWTADDNDAMSFCESRTAFPIISAERGKINNFPTVTCKFKVNLQCKASWYQMNGICYKVYASKRMTFKQAKEFCKTLETEEFEPKLADYYSSSLGLYFNDLYFSEVWVTVPDLKSYFVNGDGEAGLFVLDGAFKWDTKVGTLIMEDTETLHPAMCQYKPPMTMAQMYHLAEQYGKIYPIHVTTVGVNLASSSYMTITQNTLTTDKKPKFDTKALNDRCMSLGSILNVNSYPLASFKEEWQSAQDKLKEHRFYLTSGHKNDGCALTDYRDHDEATDRMMPVNRVEDVTSNEQVCEAYSFSFSEYGRHATKAAMRAPVLCTLQTFGFVYDQCPNGWVPFDRPSGARFCHYIHNDAAIRYTAARDECAKKQASLSGFESMEEFEKIDKLVSPKNTKNYKAAASHYWLGGVIPCNVNCEPDYVAHWEAGVSTNTSFLNNFNHEIKQAWNVQGSNTISYRKDKVAFHAHDRDGYFRIMYYICGKYAGLRQKKIIKIKMRKP